MTNQAVVVAELDALEELGAQSRIFAVTKSSLRRGWEGASLPGVIESLQAEDAARINDIGAALIARRRS